MEENKKENLFKRLLKKEVIISLVVGLVLGLIIMFFVANGIEGYASGRLITEGSLYGRMKQYYSVNFILDDIDTRILNKKYKLSEEDLNALKETADGYIEQYEMYGYSKEEFLKSNGFENYDKFVEYLSLDYKRSLYVYDYIETQLEKNAVQDYYNENAFGKIDTKHILVKTSANMSDAQALALANEIISNLNEGKDFDTVAADYVKNNPDNIISEELGYRGAFDHLDEGYVEGMKKLEAGKYSEEPVKSSFGYHIIYCVDKKEKTEEISNRDKMAIVDVLATEAELTLDQTTYYKALIQMREKAGLKFFDKEFKEKYEEYCEPYVEKEEEKDKNETELNISVDTEE